MSLKICGSYDEVLKKSKNAVIICHTVLFCLELGAQSIDVIWALFAQSFGINSKTIGWIGFGFYIAVGFGDIIFGTLADKIGFPLVVSITLIMFALCCLFQGILSNISIIAMISILSGFANCCAVLKLGFTTYLLPHKFVIKYQVIAAVCTVFASCIGPLITAIIMIIMNDYDAIFYFYAISLTLLFIASLYNIQNERKIIKLQQIKRVPSNENNDSDKDNEKPNTLNENRNFQVSQDKEMEFPINLYNDRDNIEKKWYKLNLPPLTFWEWMHIILLMSFSFFNWGVVQIFSNWYVFYAKHRYNASVSISSFQIAVSIIFVSVGVIISMKINKCMKHDQLKDSKIGKFICCINTNDNFLKEIEQNAQTILLCATFVAALVSYSCVYVNNSYTMWLLVPCCTLLLGIIHQCLIVLYLAVQPPKNAGFILGLKYVSRNFGAASCNLFVGYMMHYNLNWFWISFTLCISIEFAIVICMFLSNVVRRKYQRKTQTNIAYNL